LKFPGNFAVESYPVDVRLPGIIIIFLTVLVIGGIASWLPVRFLPKKFFELREE
jgi:lipoprotein-releasing system permease protein